MTAAAHFDRDTLADAVATRTISQHNGRKVTLLQAIEAPTPGHYRRRNLGGTLHVANDDHCTTTVILTPASAAHAGTKSIEIGSHLFNNFLAHTVDHLTVRSVA